MQTAAEKSETIKKMEKKLLTIGHSYVVALNRSLMREIQARGVIDVTVLAPEYFHGDLRSLAMEPEPAGSRLDVRPVRCHFSKKIHFFFYDPFQLRKYLREEKFDYCYLWEEPYIVSGFQVARALQAMKKPYSIFTAQNLVKSYPWPFSSFESYSLRRSEAVWPCGHLVQNSLEQKGYGDLKTRVFPLPVDLEKFKPLEASQKEMQKEKLGLKGKKVIGFMGRFTPEKGCRIFMKTVEALLANPTYGALMIGSGPLEKEIRAWVEKSGFQERVKVVSLVHSAVPTVLPSLDVLLCPSQPTPFWEEQFGRMIVEGMACGVPVIGSHSGEIPHVIGDAGLVVEPDDVAGWTKCSEKILWQESFSQNLVKKGLERAQTYSARALAPLLEKNILEGISNIK
jgi:glycosyltransferase involved in cell wall biosynthesis